MDYYCFIDDQKNFVIEYFEKIPQIALPFNQLEINFMK